MTNKLHILLLLAFCLPLLAHAAPCSPCKDDTAVTVIPCRAARAFTIRVPVRLPVGVTAEYEWYRNSVAIPGAWGVTAPGRGVIAYTVPASSAQGNAQTFHFTYRRSDDSCADCWDTSPWYVLNWSLVDFGCVTSGGEIGGTPVQSCSAGAGGEIGGTPVQSCSASAGGEIGGTPVQSCSASAGGEIGGAPAPHCTATDGGEIGGTPVQFCGAGAGGVIN